jgi:hypothetical protein
MEKHEKNLLLGALPCAARALLLYGTESSRADVAAALKEQIGALDTIDLASGGGDAARLRADLTARFAKGPSVLLVVGEEPPVWLRDVVADVQRGVFKEGEQARELPKSARLFVFCGATTYGEDDAKPFGLQIVGVRVLKEQRAKVAAAEAELRRRQERARESSRQHGLV